MKIKLKTKDKDIEVNVNNADMFSTDDSGFWRASTPERGFIEGYGNTKKEAFEDFCQRNMVK